MAQSADRLLDQILGAARSPITNSLADRRALEQFLELDRILSAGGPLPSAWCTPAERAAEDVPLPGDVLQVTARRWDHGWELHVAGMGVTQCESLDDAGQLARDYITTLTGQDPGQVVINLVIEPGGHAPLTGEPPGYAGGRHRAGPA